MPKKKKTVCQSVNKIWMIYGLNVHFVAVAASEAFFVPFLVQRFDYRTGQLLTTFGTILS